MDHLSSRSPLHRLGEGQGRGGKRLPRAALLPHCDRCLTGASALDFGHPRLYLQSSVEKTGREAEKDGNFRLHVGGLLLGPSGALCCSAGAFGDTSGKPTFSWPSWGVAPRLSKTWSEKASGGAVAHQRASSAPVVARECSLSPPLWSPLRSQPRCPRVVREDERVRISAPCHVWRRFPRSRLHSLRFHQ